jgi:hypothetical protein
MSCSSTALGKDNLRNGADGISEIEDKVARVATKELEKRASFKSDKILSIARWIFAGGRSRSVCAKPHWII